MMQLGARAAALLALPITVMALGTVLLPFAWRGASVALACFGSETSGCPMQQVAGDAYYLGAILNTIWLSAASCLMGLAIGLGAAAWAAARTRTQPALQLLASLGANMAGVPLALALLLLVGGQGFVTLALQSVHVPLVLSPGNAAGMLLAYTCFQAPLAFLLLLQPVRMQDPALAEASALLGASRLRFTLRVGLPLLLPSLLEAGALLFANAAAAYATPLALAGTAAHVLAVRIAALVSGDLFADPGLAALLSLLLFALVSLVITGCRLGSTFLRKAWHV